MKIIRLYKIIPIENSDIKDMTPEFLNDWVHKDPEIKVKDDSFCDLMVERTRTLKAQTISIDNDGKEAIAKLFSEVYHLQDKKDDIKVRMEINEMGEQLLITYDYSQLIVDAKNFGTEESYSIEAVRLKTVFAQVCSIEHDDKVKTIELLARTIESGQYIEAPEDIKYLSEHTNISNEFEKHWESNCVLSIEDF